MKKKTKFKSRNNLLKAFLLTILVCLLGAALNSFLFYTNFFRALTKLNEEPIATITFKYKTAQRKFIDRVVWDRLRQNSPVYNGDTVHTEALSEAIVHFPDGNIMELSENTMAQIFLTEDKFLKTELSEGFAIIDASSSTKGMTLSSNGVEVDVEQGASVSASSVKSDSDVAKVSLQVLRGQASLQSEGNSEVQLSQGEALLVEGGEHKTPQLIVTEPSLVDRVLYHTEGKTKVSFKWTLSVAEKNTKVSIWVAKDKNFSNVVYNIETTNVDQTEMTLDSGIYYWKVFLTKNNEENIKENGNSKKTDNTKDETLSTQIGKLQVIQSLIPSLVAPAEHYVYNYRTRYPAVRLIWTESSYATSYKVEVSDNAEMKKPLLELRTSLPSLILSSLGEGNYYWQVTPYYTINKIGFASPSSIGNFTIEKKGSLAVPSLYIPLNNQITNIDAKAKKIAFSWKQEDEAELYRIKIANNENLNNPIIDIQTTENFFTVNPTDKSLPEGKLYWAVSYQDTEGNFSESSAVRTFYAMKGNPEQHTIEPPDEYQVAQNLVPDTKFTWKRNLPENFVTEIQISPNEDFSKIVYKQNVTGSSLKSLNLAIGTYYWRLKSSSTTDGTELITSSKVFHVVDNLDATELLTPTARAVARQTVPYNFTWSEVEDADFYKIAIYKQSDDSLVYEDIVYGTSISLDLYNGADFVDKTVYKWQIQAQANAIPGVSSRRSRKLAEEPFYLLKLRPVEIIAPAKDAKIKGSDAILKPSKAVWKTVDKVAKAQFVLTRTDVNPPEEIIKIPQDTEMSLYNSISPNEILLDTEDGLRPGTYEIIVHAETLDGIDISNTDDKNIGRFTILPIEPLSQATNLVVMPEVFNSDYLRDSNNPRTITFSWNKVPGATDYFVLIKTKTGSTILKQNVKDTKYQIDFAALTDEGKQVFSKGTFTWIVSGVKRIDTNNDGKIDKIFQEGIEAKSTFKTDVPTPKKSKVKGALNPYGN